MRTVLSKASLVVGGLVAGLAISPSAVQAAVNYFDTTRIVYGTGSASCPSGWKLTGGGAGQLPSDTFYSSTSDEYSLTGSWPYMSNSWRATATRVHGSYSSYSGWKFYTYSYSPRVYAICAS